MSPFVMLGIDLGTSKCLGAISIRGQVHWIPVGSDHASEIAREQGLVFAEGVLPSVYCFGMDAGQVMSYESRSREFLGQLAIRNQDLNPGRVIRNAKRFMDRQYASNGREPLVWEFEDDLSNTKNLNPGDIAGKLLSHVLVQAESRLRDLKAELNGTWDWDGGPIRRAVITVPAYFGGDQRRATEEYAAMRIAGLEEVKLLEEPLAAAIGLDLHRRTKPQLIMIVDVGAGTTDLSLVKVGENSDGLQEIGRLGDNNLGCLNWDVEVAKLLLEKALDSEADAEEREARLYAFEMSRDRKNERYGFDREGSLLTIAESAKMMLCDVRFTKQYRAVWKDGNRVMRAPISRQEMELQTNHFAHWVGTVCRRLIESVDLVQKKELGRRYKPFDWEQIDEVYLVGGGARIPQIVREIKRVMTPKYESRLKTHLHPEMLIARGAAIYAEMFAHNEGLDAISQRRLPHDIGYTSHVLPQKYDRHCEFLTKRGIEFLDIIPANASLPERPSDPSRDGIRVIPFSNPAKPRIQIQLWERSISIDYPDGILEPIGRIEFDGNGYEWKNSWSWWGAPKNFELTLSLDEKQNLTAWIKYGTKREKVPILPPFPSSL